MRLIAKRHERAMLAVLLVLYLAIAAWFVVQGRLNHDEGLFLYAAQSALSGELPYRDFAFIQAPLTLYVYGPIQSFFGPGLLAGRLTSLAIGTATVALGMRLAFLHGGAIAALLFLGVLACTPEQMWVYTTTRTEPLGGLLWMTCVFLLFGRARSVGGSALAVLAAVLATGTRVSSGLALLVVVGIVVHRHRDRPRELWPISMPGALAGAALLLLAWLGPLDVTWFNVITSQTGRGMRLGDAETWTLGQHVTALSQAIARLHVAYGIVPLLGLLAVVFALVRRSERDRAPWIGASIGLVSISASVYLPQLVPRDQYAQYFAPVFPIVLVVVCWAAAAWLREVPPERRRAALAVLLALVAFQLALMPGQQYAHMSRGERSDLSELAEVTRHLGSLPIEGRTLATLDTYIAVEGGYAVPPGWELGLFAYFPRLEPAEATRFHVLSRQAFTQFLANGRPGAVVLSDRALGILVAGRLSGYAPRRTLSEPELVRLIPALAGYRLDRTYESFGQFADPLYVLLPRED